LFFSIAGVEGVANYAADPVAVLVEVPPEISLEGTRPVISISGGATLSADPSEPEFPGTVNYRVTAENKDTKDYQVTVVHQGKAIIGVADAGALLFPQNSVSVSASASLSVYLTFIETWGNAEADAPFTRASGSYNTSTPANIDGMVWHGAFGGADTTISFTSGVAAKTATGVPASATIYETYNYNAITKTYQLGDDDGIFTVRQGTRFLSAAAGYEDYTWILDNELAARGRFVLINAKNYTQGSHKLTVYAAKNGVYCSKKIALVVE
jgi:hypothetical protein